MLLPILQFSLLIFFPQISLGKLRKCEPQGTNSNFTGLTGFCHPVLKVADKDSECRSSQIAPSINCEFDEVCCFYNPNNRDTVPTCVSSKAWLSYNLVPSAAPEPPKLPLIVAWSSGETAYWGNDVNMEGMAKQPVVTYWEGLKEKDYSVVFLGKWIIGLILRKECECLRIRKHKEYSKLHFSRLPL